MVPELLSNLSVTPEQLPVLTETQRFTSPQKIYMVHPAASSGVSVSLVTPVVFLKLQTSKSCKNIKRISKPRSLKPWNEE